MLGAKYQHFNISLNNEIILLDSKRKIQSQQQQKSRILQLYLKEVLFPMLPQHGRELR